ncbi:MAG: translation initiation factor IF-2 [Gemmatimonadales bacterium]
MAKTRIHDLAAEFGIESAKLIEMLADMGIHVRSHLSGLDEAQVARVRTRWEREKRRAKDEKKTTKRARRRTKKKAAADTAEKPKPAARPRRRRRTAAEMAAREHAEEQRRAAEEEAERATAAVDDVMEKDERSVEERAAALFREPEPEAAVAESEADVTAEPAEPAEPVEQTEPEAPAEERAAATAEPEPEPEPEPAPEPVKPLRVDRVAPPRSLRPVASSGPRPVASAAPGEAAEERRRDKKRRRKGKRSKVDKQAVQANISRTLASIKGPGPKKSRGRRDDEPRAREIAEQRRQEEREREKTLVRVTEFITVSELAEILNVPPTDVVTFCFKELGMMVTVNQRLDFDQIDLIAGAFGFQAAREEEYVPTESIVETEADKPEDLRTRPPVVTVMGHVDHGKTSLLDHIRKTNVIAGESGGITQHIGAYHAVVGQDKAITFLDTPGHEAFTAMRARGAQVTDIVVLMVAADDQVMPQTIEAISHAKNAGVPIVVAINKIDLPSADPEKVKQDLLQHNVVVEEYGGDAMAQAISAKSGDGVDDLLEKILLQAELLDKQANPDRLAQGVVVESSLDPGKGPVATVLVQTGTLRVGDNFICGNLAGRVRALLDERGQRVEHAGPSIPVQVLGFDGVPEAGDQFNAVPAGTDARDIAQKRQRLDREAAHRRSLRGVSLEDLSKQIEEGEVQALKMIIKADQAGPAEALADAVADLSTPEVRVEVVHRGVGAITESDILLAKASDAVVVGFHVRPDANARSIAEREKVDIRTYRVIYEAVEDVRQALEGMLAPEEKEVVLGEAEVRQTFKISGVGTIAGCYVRSGVIRRNASIRVIRDGVEIYDGRLASLKRFKDDAREVKEGLECGIGVENFNDVKVGDVLEAYQIEEIARSLEAAGAMKDS